jgi:hypothetical protein
MQLGYTMASFGYGIATVLLSIGLAVCCMSVKSIIKKILKGGKNKADKD